YLNGPAPLSQPAGFDLPGLPAMPGMPMARKPADDGAGVVPYIVAAIVAGVVLFVGMAFLLFSGGKSSDPQVAGLGAPPQHVVMPPPPRVVPPTPVGRGAPLGAPSTNSSASRPVAIRPSGAGDLAAPSAQPEKTTAEAPKYVPPKRGDLGAPSAGGAEDEKPAPSGLASAPAASAFADGAMSPTGEATNPGGGPPVSNLGWQLELPENVPTWEFKKNWSMRLSLPRSHGEVAFASENRPFVAFASTSDKSPWEVWDLAGLKRVGAYKGSLALAKEGALSPSGKKIAAKSDGFRSGGTVYVVDVSSGKTLNELQVGDNDAPKFFCGDDWLVTQVWGSGELTVYDLAQSQEAYKIGGRFSLDPGKYAVVPGGKYFLIAQDDKIIAFETATGARAGELRSEGFSHNFKGFAVSWDAKELAVLYSDGKFVATFDLATGDQTGDIKLNEAAADPPFGHWCKVNPIQWLPAREGWLLNAHAVVDRESGGPVWVIPAGKSGGSKVGPIVLPNYTVIGPEDTWETSVVSVALPKEKIADAARAVRAGGEATDAALPPITLAKIDGVQTFAVADGAENWTVKPDPAGGKKLMAAPMTLKSPLKNIHEVEFASPSSGMLVMGCGEEQHGNRAANG
ncbi:MAG TPA: WD40 repeat domain-containing protein, partial [Pirellulales bacterium]